MKYNLVENRGKKRLLTDAWWKSGTNKRMLGRVIINRFLIGCKMYLGVAVYFHHFSLFFNFFIMLFARHCQHSGFFLNRLLGKDI